MDPDELRRFNSEIAKAVAPGWERRRAFIEETVTPVREWMLDALAPSPGDTVLELAAGVGDTGYQALALAGEGGRLISTDFSPEMVEAARRRSEALGLSGVEHRVMDAERIELDADSVDGVLCRYGYMLMPDPAAALAETRRVLRPGGRVALAVWGPPEGNAWLTICVGALMEAGHVPPPEPGAPTPFSLGEEGRLRALLEGAGFAEVRIEEVPVSFAFDDVDAYLAMTGDTAGPLVLVLRGLSDDDRKALKAKLGAAFAPFAAEGGGYELPGLAVVAVAS